MGELTYKAKLKLDHQPGTMHDVYVQGFEKPIEVGAHGTVKRHMYRLIHPKVPESSVERIHSLEYVTAAIAASAIETLGDLLEARGIVLAPDDFTAEVEGDFEKNIGPPRPVLPGRVSVLSRIRIRYRLKVPPRKRQIVEELLREHLHKSAVFQSIEAGIKAEWDWEISESR